jgi:hypothetical protein
MPPRNSHAELETHDVGSGIGTISSPHVRTTKEGVGRAEKGPEQQEVGFAWLAKNLRGDASRMTAPYDVMPDGTGFIGVQSSDGEGGEAPAPQIITVQHWFTELQRLVPVD